MEHHEDSLKLAKLIMAQEEHDRKIWRRMYMFQDVILVLMVIAGVINVLLLAGVIQF